MVQALAIELQAGQPDFGDAQEHHISAEMARRLSAFRDTFPRNTKEALQDLEGRVDGISSDVAIFVRAVLLANDYQVEFSPDGLRFWASSAMREVLISSFEIININSQ